MHNFDAQPILLIKILLLLLKYPGTSYSVFDRLQEKQNKRTKTYYTYQQYFEQILFPTGALGKTIYIKIEH